MKRVFIVFIGLVMGIILLPVMLYMWVESYSDTVFTGNAECGVVFGAAVWKDDKPSDALLDRINSGIELYQDGHISCLIVSGGASKIGEHEALVMERIALEAGVPKDALIVDYMGIRTRSTLENLPKNKKSFVMISNDFHLARIRLLSIIIGVPEVSLHRAIYHNGNYNADKHSTYREMTAIIAIIIGEENAEKLWNWSKNRILPLYNTL